MPQPGPAPTVTGGPKLMTVRDGVVRFQFDLHPGSAATEHEAQLLCRWRQRLYDLDVIGCDLSRYGACYGNVSIRTGPWAAGPGRREFLVSCTQSGGQSHAGPETLCRIIAYDHRLNRVSAQGPCPPSSETLTHGAMYDASLELRAIVHGHAPRLWRYVLDEGGPATPPEVEYGTPEMADEARRIVREAKRKVWRLSGVLAMAGHEDGVIAWGSSAKEATERFITAWETAEGSPPRT